MRATDVDGYGVELVGQRPQNEPKRVGLARLCGSFERGIANEQDDESKLTVGYVGEPNRAGCIGDGAFGRAG